LYEAGKKSSTRFIEKHPVEYSKLAYAKADVRYSKKFLIVIRLVPMDFLWFLVNLIDWLIKKKFMSYKMLKGCVKYCSGLAYLLGTKEADLFR
jgi:hypothetical protein